jgi:hypothetical protein
MWANDGLLQAVDVSAQKNFLCSWVRCKPHDPEEPRMNWPRSRSFTAQYAVLLHVALFAVGRRSPTVCHVDLTPWSLNPISAFEYEIDSEYYVDSTMNESDSDLPGCFFSSIGHNQWIGRMPSPCLGWYPNRGMRVSALDHETWKWARLIRPRLQPRESRKCGRFHRLSGTFSRLPGSWPGKFTSPNLMLVDHDYQFKHDLKHVVDVLSISCERCVKKAFWVVMGGHWLIHIQWRLIHWYFNWRRSE